MPKVELPLYFDCRIAGVSFPNPDGSSRQEIIPTLEPGQELTLKREPKNKFDKNAIAIYAGKKQVGYIPAKGAVVLIGVKGKLTCVVTSTGQAAGNGLWSAGIRVSWKEKR